MVRSFNTVEMLAILACCLLISLALFNGALTETWLTVVVLVATGQVGWIIWRDSVDFIIPDGAVVVLALSGAIVRIVAAQDDWPLECLRLAFEGACCGLVFLAVRELFFRIKGFDGMGFGDVKLAMAAGILVGLEGFAWSVFAASALGLAGALLVSIRRPDLKIHRLPFGALLAPVCWSVWLLQLWSAV